MWSIQVISHSLNTKYKTANGKCTSVHRIVPMFVYVSRCVDGVCSCTADALRKINGAQRTPLINEMLHVWGLLYVTYTWLCSDTSEIWRRQVLTVNRECGESEQDSEAKQQPFSVGVKPFLVHGNHSKSVLLSAVAITHSTTANNTNTILVFW
jgi:hypothetical protein